MKLDKVRNIFTKTMSILIVLLETTADEPPLTTEVNSVDRTDKIIPTLESEGSTYCGYLLFNGTNPPKKLDISVGQILNPPEFQSLFNKFTKGSSIIMIDQPDTKICKIVICGYTTDFGYTQGCWEYDKIQKSVTLPYSRGFEMSSVRCGCGTGIMKCAEDTCAKKVLDESSGTICAVLYEEYECGECYFTGTPLYHDQVYDTHNSKEILSIYVHPGCNLVRTMGPPLGYNTPSYDVRLNASRSQQDLTYSRISDVYKCECYKLIERGTYVFKPVPTSPNEIESSSATASSTASSTASQKNIPATSTIRSSSTNRVTENPKSYSYSPSKSANIEEESETATNATNYILTGVGIFISVSVCITCVTLTVIYKRYKVHQKTDVESISLSTIKSGEMKSYIKDFIEGSTIQNKPLVVEESSLEEKLDCDPREKSYSVALSLPYDSKLDVERNHFTFGKLASKEIRWNFLAGIIDATTVIYVDPEDAKCKIGYGAFGMVYKGTLLTFDDRRFIDIAIKTVQGVSDCSGKELLKSLLNEIKVLSFVGYHENIVYFIGACTVNLRKCEVYLLMGYCSNGNLLKYLQNMPTDEEKRIVKNELNISKKGLMGYMTDDGSADEQIIETLSQENYNLMVLWSVQIANGMEFLASKEVLHIDLAARNVLLTKDLTAKISDFGLSRKIYTATDYKKNRQDVLIPLPWMALETVMERRTDKRYSKKSDIWAYGITIWEIFSKGKEPYAGMEYQDIFCMLNRGERLDQPQFAPENVYDTMLTCWTQDPNERPDFKTLKEFFQKILTNYEKEIKHDL